MRFVLAAYIVALVTLGAYGANLARERRALGRQLQPPPK